MSRTARTVRPARAAADRAARAARRSRPSGVTARLAAAAALATALLLGGAPGATADDHEPGQQEDGEPTPMDAGSGFRTAAVLEGVDLAVSPATIGEYLYWAFPVGAGSNATAAATVDLTGTPPRSGPVTWQLDLYDGLRRRQSCVAGSATVTAPPEAESVELSCELRTVRAWAEPWSNDPLPGAYYLRLTAVALPEEDLGLPVSVLIEARAEDAGGSRARGGDLGDPLVLTARAGTLGDDAAPPDPDAEAEESAAEPDTGADAGSDGEEIRYAGVVGEPDGGWNGGWWSDRWLWTAGGGLLGALAAIAGYTLTRHPRRRVRD